VEPYFIFSGGGTGGHLYPALSVLEELSGRYPSARFQWIGASGRIEETLIPARGIPIQCFTLSGMDRSRGVAGKCLSLGRSLFGFTRAAASLALQWIRQRPRALVISGAYISVPAALAAMALRIPFYILEQNSLPGLSNRVLAPFARRVFAGLPLKQGAFSSLARVTYSGNPVRQQFLELRKSRLTDGETLRKNRREAIEELGLKEFNEDPGICTCLVMGGSLGSDLFADLLEQVLESGDQELSRMQFILMSGTKAKTLEGNSRLISLPYTDRMDLVYGLADIMVARAGATTVAEIAVLGMPSVLIPWKGAAERHQDMNASLFADTCCCIIPEEQVTAENFVQSLKKVYQASRNRESVEQIAGLGKPEAAREIVDCIVKDSRR